jgi:hypothetical protein
VETREDHAVPQDLLHPPSLSSILDSKSPLHSPRHLRAGIFKQSMGARNRGGIYRFIVPARQATWAGRNHSLESIPGLHKRLKLRAQAT